MAIKCSAETTITNQIDATDLIMWYYATTLTTKPLSPSTTSASATPTGWSLIEPTITSASDLSKYIYECLQIVWGDGTCSWGDVQLSASFEAAKQAYNLAHSTASIFTTFEQTHNKTLVDTVNESSSAITTLTESHQYGGINLLSNTKSIDSSSAPYTNSNISLYSNQAPIDGESFYYCSGPKYFQIDFPTLINNQKYTLSFDISRSSNSQPVFVKIDGTETNIGTATTTWTRLSHTFTASASTTNAQIRVAFDSTSSTATYIAAIRHIKLEQGSLATPWEYSSNDISTLSNTVNTVSQTADSNSSTISNLTQTLGTNANGTTKTDDIVHQVSNINQDLNGITTRVGKTEIALKGNYAVSSTAKGTANKQATISPTLANYELVQGAAITVKFTTENTAANPTLNINSTGAKPIKTYSGAALSENEYKWDAGSTMTFVYDGTNWCIQDSTELTRIKSNETLINQTANNVLIKATESDTTAAQGGQHLIQSLINVAPNGIKISADKVDIEGAAIFSENGYLSQDNINAINNESQMIYIQAVSGTSSVSGTTTWVTNTGESVTQDAANLTPVWTIKRPIYRTNYPVLFVATQYKTIDGTVTCTTPLKDDTITVIDAGHITTGTIDASNITVTNLNADNITTGTINGQRIGVGSLSLDKLAEDVYTETEVNNIVDNLQTQIDGAIETWTGTNVPTLNNTPASTWTTDSIKDTHVGDVYFVVNDQSQQNGYNYRFTKTISNGTSTYSWQLIKDNDVTNALQRLTTAEGKIGNIETFDSTVSSYMTNTDNELSSIKSAATTLAGRVDTAEGTLATKVDTSTFNTLSQTVEGNTQSISSLNTTITTKADSSTVSALQTQTNTISDTVNGHTQSITSLNNTVATKADGSEVTTLSNNLSSLQQDVNGFKTTVSETYSTKVETKMTSEAEGNIIWVDDAMAAPAIELIVQGASTQADTPTPDAPVPILSVDDLALVLASSNLLDIEAFSNIANWKTSTTYAGFTLYVPNGTYTIKYDGEVIHESNVYLNVNPYRNAASSGNFLAHPNSNTGSASRTLSVANGALTFGLYPKNAATLAKVIQAIGSTLRVNVGSTATAYEPYQDTTVPDLLPDGTELRSLPDGTRDTLSLSYLRPSTRAGWAVYQATLTALVDETTTAATDGITGTVGVDVMSTTDEIADGSTVLYKLATPVTTTLDPIELPILHSSICTVWATADATPGLYMKYWTLSAEGIVEPLLISDSNSEAQLSAISSRISTAESNITQNADNIATKVSKDGVISSINQSAESIKIQASKVSIDGTAIFTNSDFQTQLNNQGYATTTQVATAKSEAISAAASDATSKANAAQSAAVTAANSATDTKLQNYTTTTGMNTAIATAKQEAIDSIEVGGRNLVYNNNLSTVSGYSNDSNISYLTYMSVANYLANLEDGDPIVISFDAKADSNITAAEVYAYQESGHSIANDGTSHWKVDLTTEWQRYIIRTTVKDWTGTHNAGSIMFLYKSGNNTVRYLRKLKIESGTIATDWTPAPEDVDASISAVDSSLETYKSATNTTLTSLQNQVDGQIEAWYKSVDPTGSNEPASTWTTDALKARHMGDLYYNVTNGHSWRWMQSGNTYEWQQIPDSDAAAALAAAQNAQTLANSKRRIFTSIPTPPYDVGDLWVDGTNVKYASTSKTDDQTYSENDWAVTATDDTLAQTALDTAETVQDNLNATRTWYATCETAAATAVKVATITPETTAFELRVGTIVNVEFTATNRAAVANLKLNVNNTGEKSIKYMYNYARNNIPAVGYLVAGIVYQFMYDGDYWTIQNMHYNTNTTYNLSQNLYSNTIKAKSAIVAETIIVGDANGYAQVQSGVTFDISYPILWCTKALAVNGTNSANLFTSVQDRNLKTNYSSFQGTANAMVYLVGTVSGNTFTIDSNALTSTEPTTEDGKIYIPIGRHGNQYVYASAPAYFFFDCQTTTLFAYLDGEFRQVTPTEIVSTHRIYYRTATANSSLAAPTTWIEEATGNVYNQWTTKVPPLAASTASGQTKYLYLYTCEQRKRLDGTTVCTKVLLDENTTVIDGGSIITNSVTANQIAAGTITAAEIEAGTITATEIASNAITTDKLDANAVTAAKIDATNLHVSAANIDGTITFGQLSGVQASGNYALSSDIPQDISDLTNDVGFITSDDVPTTVAELTDSSNYALNSAIPTTVAQLTDSSNYALTSSIPTTVAQLTDSSNYALASNLTTEINQRKAQYGTCSTAAGTTPKAVTCANFELVAGNEITVKFSNANTSSGKIQLNVNSKGNKDVWVGNAVTSASNMLLWGANAYITFKYDGTQFQVIGEPRTWYGECSVAEATAAKTSTITGCVICKGTKVELAMTYANSAASPTLNVSSTGAKNLYFGTGTTRPTISGGTSWLAANTATFTFDGATWRTQGKTYIDANSITTGYISADRIQGGSLSIGMFNNSTQADILNSNITVPQKVSDLTNDTGFITSSSLPTKVSDLDNDSYFATQTEAQGYATTAANGKDSAIAAAARRTDVAIAVTAIDYDAGTATLQATLYIDGVVTTNNVTYKWLKDGSLISGATSRTLSVTAAMGLGHIYSCTIDYT